MTLVVRGKLKYLMVAMIVLLVLSPFLQDGVVQSIFLNALISAVCFLAVHTVSHLKRNFYLSLSLCLVWFMTAWFNMLITPPAVALSLVSSAALALLYGFTAIMLLNFVLKSTKVSEDILYGSVSIYLFIGALFYMVYSTMEIFEPGTFLATGGALHLYDLLYFSFVTLTTMGYGDIVPATSLARIIAVFEAVLGVMYLAIIISRTVGMYIVQQAVEKKKR